MKLASHNSWSYLPPMEWWMRLWRFTARCQDADIKTQYEKHGVRCFDLRVRFMYDRVYVVHGSMVYDYEPTDITRDLQWLNDKKDVYVRVILDVRSKKKCTSEQKAQFVDFCFEIEKGYPGIKFWCGERLYDHEVVYKFKNNPGCEEQYASVCSPKWIDDWYPRRFAKKNNKALYEKGTKKKFLMLDFVNYCGEVE